MPKKKSASAAFVVLKKEGEIPGHPECIETSDGQHRRVAGGALQTCYLYQQPMPTRNPDSVEVTPLLIKHCETQAQFHAVTSDKSMESIWLGIKKDLLDRNELGIQTYGTPLFTNNGRNPLLDCYQEQLDAAKYWQQHTTESGKITNLILMKMLGLLSELKQALLEQAKPVTPVQAD